MSAYARNLSEIVEGAQRIVGDYVRPQSNGLVWAWSEVHEAANDTILDLVNRTHVLKDVRVVSLRSGVNIYDLPPDCLRPLRVGMHGASGYVVLPKSMEEVDLEGVSRAALGDPLTFFLDFLKPNQIGVLPIPYRDGSSMARDSDYGLLRRVEDGVGDVLPQDSSRPLRVIRGVPIERSGNGEIIREVVSPNGNLRVHFVRTPAIMNLPGDYPDRDIPEWVHPDIKYGVAARLLIYRRGKLDRIKLERFSRKWLRAATRLQRISEYQGLPGQGARAM